MHYTTEVMEQHFDFLEINKNLNFFTLNEKFISCLLHVPLQITKFNMTYTKVSLTP